MCDKWKSQVEVLGPIIGTHDYAAQICDGERHSNDSNFNSNDTDTLSPGVYTFYVTAPTTKETVGHLSFYYAYSTWEGPFPMIMELEVNEQLRRRGIATQLLLSLIKAISSIRNSDHKFETMYNIIDAKSSGHLSAILKMIKLAVFEMLPDGPKLTVHDLKIHLEKGFWFGYVVVEGLHRTDTEVDEEAIVAYAMLYNAMDKNEEPYLFLEDIYVKPELRQKGIGAQLMARVIERAIVENVCRLQWDVLSWNTAAINFYREKLGATLTDENCDYYRLTPNHFSKI